MFLKIKYKWRTFLIAIVLAGLAIFTIALNREHWNKKMTIPFPPHIEVHLGQHGNDWKKTYGDIVEINDKNPGLSFYSIDPDNYKQTVSTDIKTGTMTTTIHNTMRIEGTEDRDRSVGFADVNIYAKVNKGGMLPHQEAYQYVTNLIHDLRKKGWTYNLYETDPRLKGKAALNYFKQNNLDPDYPLSFNEWMTLPAPLHWRFYADNTYLELTVDRDIKNLDPKNPGAYFISLSFQTREEAERTGLPENEKDHWRGNWVKRALSYRSERNIAEAKLRAQGIPIDTDYRDPPLPPAPPGQKNPKIPESLK
ncbi:hypothetical protein [Chromobacterium piscinae]|uniref:Uncharacterized protein n=1 Tax=Chromobacterium piscinae TaxID=686831 RepID=A0ABV0H928_9NEIS|nr:hypothetical protein [Chromobacterium vaccinii]MBX9355354.1 hypothetical protein [Chromobacterium vaccinii]NHQ83760.1 hypothetical protein [Chromobacterium vaccinii]